MQSRTLKLAVFFLVAVSLVSSVPVWAQSTSTGTVAGTISDPSGAVVAGATVTLTDPSTNSTRTATTNATGRYFFADVTPGKYSISVSKAGFSTVKADNQAVQVGLALTVNLALQVGGANVVVEVSAVGNELQTMNATVGNTVTGDLVNYLPSLGRDVNTFIELQPGVGTDGSVAGAVNDQNYFSLDGGNNSNDMDGAGGVYVPNLTVGDPTGGVGFQNQGVGGPSGVMPTPQDSVEEFKVDTTGQTADFNSSAGAEVKVATKRGTNTFHGTVYEYYKDNTWSANSYQNEVEGVALPPYHYNRYGGAIGGPLIPKEVLGGKTYFFFNYEGWNWPNVESYFRDTPSAALRLGLVTDTVNGTVYNLNPYAVTYNGITYAANNGCAGFTGGLCDPLGKGLNPTVAKIWDTWMPASNSTSCALALCDGVNVQAFAANLALKTTSRFAVARIDHDFSAKEHFMTSWRYYHLNYATDDQVDIGGFFPGDTLGTPTSLSSKPVRPWYLVAGLTSNITTNTTNDFHYSYLRNWWAYSRVGPIPQLPGLGGALEIESGQSQLESLTPYNVNNQQVRNRFWDGKDNMVRDDISMLKGIHLLQFGGQYQHNFNWHQRTDNGGTIDNLPVYDLGYGSSGSLLSADAPICGVQTVPGTGDIANCGAVTAAVLGIVSASEVAYTRTGPNLALQPIGTPATAKSNIPYYNVYFSDTWHMKPTFTLTYGLSWALEMPPVEESGQQVELVDQADQPISTEAWLTQRKRAALAGQVYNPEIGYSLIGNTANAPKYPYNPYYGEFGPRIAAAWNPHFDADSWSGKLFGTQDTVIRGGYGRIYGRLNGVDLVLVPLLAPGIIQPVQCVDNLANGTCGASGTATASNAFRVGSTTAGFSGFNAPIPAGSATLPQPYFPGYNQSAAGPGEALDPNFRPNSSDAFDLTIQRQLSHRATLEIGYIGRRIEHEYQPVNINAVPYMMTLGGQQFSAAWRNVLLQYCGGFAGMAGGGCAGNAAAVTPQPFFEHAMNKAYCAGFSSCTAAVVANEGPTGNFQGDLMWNLWSDLDNGGFNFPRSMMNTPIAGSPVYGGNGQTASGVGVNASIGHGNYNAVFGTLKTNDWRGMTMQSNFTWAKALGTGAEVQATSEYTPDDPFNLNQMYGRQAFDRKITYNAMFVYEPPFYKGQQGVVGRLLGGWIFSSVFAAGTGTPVQLYGAFGNGSPWGEGDNTNFFGTENAVPIGPIGAHGKAYYNSPSSGLPVNIFKNGVAEASNWRNPIIGIDTRDGGEGILNGLRFWNTDMSIAKNVRVAESVTLRFQAVFQNVFNHNQFQDPTLLGLYSPSNFGALYSTSPFGTMSTPRNLELGARVTF